MFVSCLLPLLILYNLFIVLTFGAAARKFYGKYKVVGTKIELLLKRGCLYSICLSLIACIFVYYYPLTKFHLPLFLSVSYIVINEILMVKHAGVWCLPPWRHHCLHCVYINVSVTMFFYCVIIIFILNNLWYIPFAIAILAIIMRRDYVPFSMNLCEIFLLLFNI